MRKVVSNSEPQETIIEGFDDQSDDELRQLKAGLEVGSDEWAAVSAELDARILPQAGEGGDY